MSLLSIKEAARELSVSQQWLKYWLVANPVDETGVPFYVPMGRRWKFEPQDIGRILAHLRKLESARLGPSVKSKARLAGLMSQLGRYEPTQPAGHSVSTDRLADLAVSGVLGPRRSKPFRRRVRLPKHKPQSEG